MWKARSCWGWHCYYLRLGLILASVAVVFFLFTPKVVAFSLRIGTSNEVL